MHDDDDEFEFEERFPPEPTPFELLELARQTPPVTLTACPDCGGPSNPQIAGYQRYRAYLDCPACGGVGYQNVPTDDDVLRSTRPGSEERVAIMSARYRAGLHPLPEVLHPVTRSQEDYAWTF